METAPSTTPTPAPAPSARKANPVNRLQGILAGIGLLLGVGLFAWGFSQMRLGSSAPAKPVEMKPVVETITGEVKNEAPAAPSGTMTDEQARKRELLEVRKFNALHGNP